MLSRGCRTVRSLLRDEAGLTSVEYAILLALMIVAGMTCLSNLGCEMRWTVRRAGYAFGAAMRH